MLRLPYSKAPARSSSSAGTRAVTLRWREFEGHFTRPGPLYSTVKRDPSKNLLGRNDSFGSGLRGILRQERSGADRAARIARDPGPPCGSSRGSRYAYTRLPALRRNPDRPDPPSLRMLRRDKRAPARVPRPSTSSGQADSGRPDPRHGSPRRADATKRKGNRLTIRRTRWERVPSPIRVSCRAYPRLPPTSDCIVVAGTINSSLRGLSKRRSKVRLGGADTQ